MRVDMRSLLRIGLRIPLQSAVRRFTAGDDCVCPLHLAVELGGDFLVRPAEFGGDFVDVIQYLLGFADHDSH